MNDKQLPDDHPSRSHWYQALPEEDADSEEYMARSVSRGRTRERLRRRQESRVAFEWNWTWVIIFVAIIAVIALITLIVFTASRGQGGTTLPSTTGIPTGRPLAVNSTPVTINLSNIKAWDGKQRFTILVMGLDKLPDEQFAGARTDSLLIVSLDPATKSVGILSIPRDLVVPFPNQKDMQKINLAYVIGELKQPGAGPRYAAQTVQYNFGIPIHATAVVSFDVVVALVDAVGGIDINVPEPIDDPEYPDMHYGYDPLKIPAGQIHMDGQLALKYARTRHTGSDLDRAKRQQQVIMAMRQKALQGDVLPKLVGQAPTLWSKLSQSYLTDLAFDQILGLAWYVKDIPPERIVRGTLDEKYILAIQYNGESVLTPNRAILSQLMTQVFGADYSK